MIGGNGCEEADYHSGQTSYEQLSKDDGERFLVERLWPRGMRKEASQVEDWLRMWPQHRVARMRR